ncbi:MAG TPA: Eco57I restriction-modification methylase domain-containing protein, partial [Saprospiraceae bacterium]|nr:Eco57I restriction-modification methylase domain-containing protein [Saprospiraceae bacterium]
QNGKCIYCGASQEVYDRDDALETYAYNFIHTDKPEKIFNMKFDVIIGNPPYQLTVGVEKENYAIPLYHRFIEQAIKLNPKYLSMIIPARWFTGGRGLDDFRKTMLNDKRLKVIVDYTDSRDCFPGVDIAGGICYFLWDRNYKGDCNFTNITNGKSKTTNRKLNEFEIFPRYIDALSIISKVLSLKENSLSDIVSVQTPFGFHTSYRGNPKAKYDLVKVLTSKGWVKCEKNEITKGQEMIDKYKVIFTAATTEHGGQANKSGLRKVMSSLQIIEPNTICTQSYLVGGSFDTKEEALNQVSYFSTCFVRFLLFQAITSQHISKDKFLFVPLQDFTEPWTDEKLYAKYGLTEEEIAFIESMIRPMENSLNQDLQDSQDEQDLKDENE